MSGKTNRGTMRKVLICIPLSRQMKRGGDAFKLFMTLPIVGKVLDIGSGKGEHADQMKTKGFEVVTLDHHYESDINALWPIDTFLKVGAVWCSHTLEHSRNPGAFLDAIGKVLNPGGWLAITVPPAKPQMVGGHVSIWTAGLLLYHLILAGFDCKEAMVKIYNYNISIIVKYKKIKLPTLLYDIGDIESLKQFFPMEVKQDFNGMIGELNWGKYA